MVETFVNELTSLEARMAMAEVIANLFEQWNLHIINQAELLGVKSIAPIINGEPLPENEEVLQRAGHLLAIERALTKLYPIELNLRDTWIETPTPELGNELPLKIMLEGGMDGIKKVRKVVESLLKTK